MPRSSFRGFHGSQSARWYCGRLRPSVVRYSIVTIYCMRMDALTIRGLVVPGGGGWTRCNLGVGGGCRAPPLWAAKAIRSCPHLHAKSLFFNQPQKCDVPFSLFLWCPGAPSAGSMAHRTPSQSTTSNQVVNQEASSPNGNGTMSCPRLHIVGTRNG